MSARYRPPLLSGRWSMGEPIRLKYYVISLKGQTKRQALMSEQMARLGLDFEFFAAVNGRELSTEDQARCAQSDGAILPCRLGVKVKVTNALTPAEKGCALSHLKLYQKILDDYKREPDSNFAAVVLEDDSVLNEDTALALRSLDVITEPWDVVTFSDHNSIKNSRNHCYYFDQERGLYFMQLGKKPLLLDALYNTRRLVTLASCYVIRPQACQTLIDLGYPVRIPADYLLGYLAFNRLKTFRAYPLGHYLSYLGDTVIGDRPEHALRSHGLLRLPNL